MSECVMLLTRDLPAQPDACCWLLNMLRRFPATLKELLLSTEDVVREASGLVVQAALKGAMLAAGAAGDQGGGETEDAYLAAYTAVAEAAVDAVAMEGEEGEREEEDSSRGSSGSTEEGPPVVAVGHRPTPRGEGGMADGRLVKRTVCGTVRGGVCVCPDLSHFGVFFGDNLVRITVEFGSFLRWY